MKSFYVPWRFEPLMGILDFSDWWFISCLAVFGIGKLVLWCKARFVARANCLNHIKSNKCAKGKAIGICALGRFLGPRPLKVAVNSLTTTKRRKGWFHKFLMNSTCSPGIGTMTLLYGNKRSAYAMTYEMKRGEYVPCLFILIVRSSFRIFKTLYKPLILPNDAWEEINMYWLYQVFGYWREK